MKINNTVQQQKIDPISTTSIDKKTDGKTTQWRERTVKTLKSVAGFVGGATLGALAGIAGGPIGMATGAVIGGAKGLHSAIKAQKQIESNM